MSQADGDDGGRAGGPPPLDYRSPATADRRTGVVAGEVVAGFLTWLVTLVVTVVVAQAVGKAGGLGPSEGVVIAVPAFVVIGCGVWLRVRHGWRGFLPGLLLGFGLTCLVPVGIAAVVCGSFK